MQAHRANGLKSIPLYALYGEETDVDDSGFLHIEEIAARSQLYDWEIDTHTHKGLFQTVVLLDGAVHVQLDDVSISAEAPAAITIPPATVHAFRFLPGTCGYVLTVSEAMLLDAASRRGRMVFGDLFLQSRVLGFAAQPDEVARMTALLDHLFQEFQTARRGHNSLCEWLAKSVLLLVERQHAAMMFGGTTNQARAALFTRFRDLIEQQYLNHWSVAEYAAALGVTPSKLNRLSRALANKSAFEVIQDRLLLEARRRLVYIAAPVQTLAYELGFNDPGYFNRFFKKHTGQTPAAFRRAQHAQLT